MYTVEFSKSAIKELENLPRAIQEQVAKAIRRLAQDPSTADVKKLKGRSGFRLRTGDYRILFEYSGSTTITIFAIGNRKDIY